VGAESRFSPFSCVYIRCIQSKRNRSCFRDMASPGKIATRKFPTSMISRSVYVSYSLFDFGRKFMFGNGIDLSKDFGLGVGQSDFSKTDDFKFAKASFDDSSWRTLALPHDWPSTYRLWMTMPVRATLCFAHTERSHSAGIIPRRPSGGTAVPSRFPGRPWPSNLD
jgi:hypothetical protein